MADLQNLKNRALQNPDVKREYDALSQEFELIDKLLTMREAAGLTQEELARRMGTKRSNICRIERGNTNPGWNTIKKYAHACGFEVSVDFHAA